MIGKDQLTPHEAVLNARERLRERLMEGRYEIGVLSELEELKDGLLVAYAGKGLEAIEAIVILNRLIDPRRVNRK